MKELINLPAVVAHHPTAIDALKIAAGRRADAAWRQRPDRYGTSLAHFEAAVCYGNARRLALGPRGVFVDCEA